MQKTFNPFKLWGSWLGLLVGIYTTYRDANPFSFLEPFLNIIEESDAEVNVVVGFFIGYTLHLMLRSLFRSSKRKVKDWRNTKV